MNQGYCGPAVFPSAPEVRKRVEQHLDSLPAWRTEAGKGEDKPEDEAPAKGRRAG